MTAPVLCAPLEGVTGSVFRRAHSRWFGGVTAYYMPFLSPRQTHSLTARELREVRPENNQGLRAVPQLLTARWQDFLWAAEKLSALGYREVNLNLGCPSGTVTAKGKGAGLLGRREGLEELLDEIFARCPLEISIKTRLGLREGAEFAALLELFGRYPVKRLILHPRVGRQMYRGGVDLAAYAAALEGCTLPVCYNGDLTRREEVAALLERFPRTESVMLGRGLAGDPALARRCAGGPPAAREELVGYHNDLYRGYCQAFQSAPNAVGRMKELWFYLAGLFEGGEAALKALRRVDSPAGYESWAARVLEGLPLRSESAGDWLEEKFPAGAW